MPGALPPLPSAAGDSVVPPHAEGASRCRCREGAPPVSEAPGEGLGAPLPAGGAEPLGARALPLPLALAQAEGERDRRQHGEAVAGALQWGRLRTPL